jgi:hypothetical protein
LTRGIRCSRVLCKIFSCSSSRWRVVKGSGSVTSFVSYSKHKSSPRSVKVTSSLTTWRARIADRFTPLLVERPERMLCGAHDKEVKLRSRVNRYAETSDEAVIQDRQSRRRMTCQRERVVMSQLGRLSVWRWIGQRQPMASLSPITATPQRQGGTKLKKRSAVS